MGGRVSVLGSVRVDDRPLGTGVQARILSLLAAKANTPVSADRLIDAIWGGSPEAGSKATLQVHIHRVRKLLGPSAVGPLIDTSGTGYVLRVDVSGLDSLAFEDSLRTASAALDRGEHVEAESLLAAGLDLWRGEPFGGLGPDLQLDGDVTRLEEKWMAAQEALSEVRLQLGSSDLGRLRSLVDDAPLRERRWGHLMLALYQAGRQAEALRTYREAEARLRDELGIDPGPGLRRLEEQILLQSPELDRLRPAAMSGLPHHPDRFVGRTQEVLTLADWFDRHRVVTLTGLGGIGKTRLAVAAARHASASFPDGVAFVDLSRVESGDGVLAAVCDAVGAGPPAPGRSRLDSVVDALCNGRRLLVVDSAEHVAEETRRTVDEIVTRCAGVHIVITSRVPLGVLGEHQWQVWPLSVENSGDTFSASLELLVEAAGRFEPGFRLEPEELDLADRLCARAGGIPLAIELLAASLRDRSIADLLVSLDESSDWLELGTDRIVGWALENLEVDERSALGALAVFRGGWDRQAAAGVLEAVDSDIECLKRLVDLSLVSFDRESNRFTMLEPVRAAALTAEPEISGRAAMAHAAYFVGLAQEALPQLNGIGQTDWYQRFEVDKDNFRALLERGLNKRDPAVIAALPSLGLFWFRRAHPNEGAGWFDRFDQVFDLVASGQPLAALQSAHNAMWSGRPDTAEQRLARLDPAARATGAAPLIGRVLHSRGNVIGWGRGRPSESLDTFREAFEVLAPGMDPLAVVSASSEAYMAIRAGDFERAKERIPEIRRASEFNEAFGAMAVDQVRGLGALYEGDLDLADKLLSRSLAQVDGMGLIALRGPLLVPMIWTSLLATRIDEAEARAQAAYRFVEEDNGGWRIGEVCSALGAIALARSEADVAYGWFSRGYSAALVAPETDLVLWNAAGLVECGAWPVEGARLEAAATIRRMLDDFRLATPAGVGALFPLVAGTEPHLGEISMQYLKQMMREGLHG